MNDGGNQERIQQWIVSLVVTVVCCAVFFLAFAGHFMDMQKEVTTARVEIGMLEARLNNLESNILWGQHHQAAQTQKETAPPAPVPERKTEDMPNVALPSVEAPAMTAPAVAAPPVKQPIPARPPLNVPHEFNPDENNVPSNAR
jgi:hypothetical protein